MKNLGLDLSLDEGRLDVSLSFLAGVWISISHDGLDGDIPGWELSRLLAGLRVFQ